jgi:ABC-type microcin C transport system permease subunit YejB
MYRVSVPCSLPLVVREGSHFNSASRILPVYVMNSAIEHFVISVLTLLLFARVVAAGNN